MIESMRADKHGLAIYSAEQVLDAAAQGNVVIRGWGATQLLRTVPHVPCIRILRPFDQRVSWLMKELDTEDRDMAEAEIRRSDHANATRMHDQFGVNWGDPVLFDMVLNTQRLSVRGCVEQIKTLLASPEFAETESSLALLRNLTLEAHVRTALRDDPATDHTNVNVTADDGCVTLRGVVTAASELSQAEKVVQQLAGVKSVVNELRPMRTGSRFITSTDS
jgi:cytidylate kinase